MNRTLFRCLFLLMAFSFLGLTGCATVAYDWNHSPVQIGYGCYETYSGCPQAHVYNTETFYGQILAVQPVQMAYRSNGTGGAVIGGVAGGLLGHTMGHRSGKTATTIAGAVLGSIIGNSVASQPTYANAVNITLRLDDGYTFTYTRPNTYLRAGDRVMITTDGRTSNVTRVVQYQRSQYQQYQNAYRPNSNNTTSQMNSKFFYWNR